MVDNSWLEFFFKYWTWLGLRYVTLRYANTYSLLEKKNAELYFIQEFLVI